MTRKIYIEGLIGVGKSEVLRLLEQDPTFVTLEEPINRWHFLPADENDLLRDMYQAGGSERSPALMRFQVGSNLIQQ